MSEYVVQLNTNTSFFQSTDSRGSESSHSFSPERGRRGKNCHKMRRSSDSEESDVADLNSKTKNSAQDKKTSQEEPMKGTYTRSVINMHDLGYHKFSVVL